jgi:tetratricopeptide (TPR) repeat protein
MSESKMYHAALEAIKHNQRLKARELLTRMLRHEKKNIDYWLWLSSLVESDKERIYCLQTILRIDPGNPVAERGLRILGQLPAGDDIVPQPPTKRMWEIVLEEQEDAPRGFRKIWANPVTRLLLFVGVGIVAVGVLFGGFFGPRGSIFGPPLTITPIVWTETPTHTSAPTSDFPTMTPEQQLTALPLWASLEATYTPRPPYVNTPHPRSEAFRIGLRNFDNRDYESMLSFMDQAVREEPDAPDIHYFIGEANRFMGEFDTAIQSYEMALDLNPDFAPAYLGRALAQLGLDPDFNMVPDLQSAIALEPNYADAHLEFANYQIGQGSPGAALEVLEFVAGLLDGYPRYYQLRAIAELALGQDVQALEDALKAFEMDITNLDTYLILAEAYFENDQPREAEQAVHTYGQYRQDDARYWAFSGRTQYEQGKFEDAFAALEQAIELNPELAIAHQYYGLTALALDEASLALNELIIARNLMPGVFDISLGLARAFQAVENLSDAFLQINATEDLAKSDEDLAKVYYYRAKIAHDLSQFAQEKLDWQALLDIPEGVAPQEWLIEADLYFNPPTETPTPADTSTATITFTPTASSTATPLPSTATPTP